jgi:hypothetical protein
MPLIDNFTALLPRSSCCGKTASLADPIYDHYWSQTKDNEMNKRYIVTKQIAVDAESPEDAVAKMNTGMTISLTAIERAGQPQIVAGRTLLTPPAVNS